MVNISSALKKLIDDFTLPEILIEAEGIEGEITIYDRDIVEGSISIDRKSVSGDKLEIGSALCSELKFSLYNEEGKFNDFVFEGAKLFVSLVYEVGYNKKEYVPMGVFTVDNQPRKLGTVEIKALDNMVKLSKPYDSALGYPASLSVITEDVCSKCNIVSGIDYSALVNADYVVEKAPNAEGLTYWRVLQMAAELMGACAYMDENGRLKLGWYEDTDIEITPADRYSSDFQERDITVTGVCASLNEKQYVVGEEGYVLEIKGNLLIQPPKAEGDTEPDISGILKMLQNLSAKISGFTYRPYSCEAKALPHVWPLDKVTFTDGGGNKHIGIVTNNRWTVSRSQLAGKGKTATQDGYAASPPFTRRQQDILEKTRGNRPQTYLP